MYRSKIYFKIISIKIIYLPVTIILKYANSVMNRKLRGEKRFLLFVRIIIKKNYNYLILLITKFMVRFYLIRLSQLSSILLTIDLFYFFVMFLELLVVESSF